MILYIRCDIREFVLCWKAFLGCKLAVKPIIRAK